MKGKILNGIRKDQIGFILTIIDSEGDYSVAVQFEDNSVETFDPKDVEIAED